jgi:hypothetical protein
MKTLIIRLASLLGAIVITGCETSDMANPQVNHAGMIPTGQMADMGGIWTGTITLGIQGDVNVTLTINDALTKVKEQSVVGTFTPSRDWV